MATYTHRHRETYRNVEIDIKAASSKELSDKVKKRKDQIDRGFMDDTIKLSEFGKRYLEAYKLRTVSYIHYKDLHYLLGVIVAGIGDKPLCNVRPMDLQAYLNTLTHFSDSYIKKQYDLICQLFTHAYRNGGTPTDYTLNLIKPNGKPTGNGRSITDHERTILLQVLDGHRGELFCKIMLYCGLRPSEVQALQWCDIDLRNNVIHVSKSLKADGTVGSPKTKSAYRSVPIPDHLVPLIRSKESQDPFEDVFSHGLNWRRRMWDSIKREMNIAMGCRTYRNKLLPPYPLADDFTLYNLRHTYCTDLEKAGVPINIASRLMGHSSISITSKVYTHASEEALEMARDLINSTNIGILPGKKSG